MPRPLVEIAVDNFPDALAAAQAGVDRLELRADLSAHGLSATPRALAELRVASSIPVAALVRPRAGPFVASPSDRFLVPRQAEALLAAGADAIVFGFLGEDHSIDMELGAQMVRIAGPCEAVFHRAFDLSPAPLAALDHLIDLGVKRVLTSGLSPAATAHALGLDQKPVPPEPLETRLANIRRYVDHAAGRIEILPGGGIRADNARQVLERTGVTQLHSACRQPGADTLDKQLLADLLGALGAP